GHGIKDNMQALILKDLDWGFRLQCLPATYRNELSSGQIVSKNSTTNSQNMSKRPHVICLMMTSVDGKILSEKWGDNKQVKTLTESFEKVHELIGNKNWIVGRTTMEKDFTHYAKPVYKEVGHIINRQDFVANRNAESFAVVIDGQAKLGWNSSDMLGQHV